MVDNLQTLKGIYKKKAEQSHLGLFHFAFSPLSILLLTLLRNLYNTFKLVS